MTKMLLEKTGNVYSLYKRTMYVSEFYDEKALEVPSPKKWPDNKD